MIEVLPGFSYREILIPGSKSYGNRLLIMAALTGENVGVKGLPDSTDVKSLIYCLRMIGLQMNEEADGTLRFLNRFPECETESEGPVLLETGDGGTTNRFLMALLSRGKKEYRLKMQGKMPERPLLALLSILKESQVKIHGPAKDQSYHLALQGPFDLSTRTLFVDCSETTQFASALMLALHGTEVEVVPQKILGSDAYLAMTQEILRHCPRTPGALWNVNIDFSSLTYPLALSVFFEGIRILNCFKPDPLQADSQFLEVLRSLKVSLSWDERGLEVGATQISQGLEFDVASCPDLFPSLVFLCAYVVGTSCLSGLRNLRYKESDRISEMLKLLDLFKVEHTYYPIQDILEIRGPAPMSPYLSVFPPQDHRIIMAAYLFLKKNSGGRLDQTEHIQKSFPDFLKRML